MANKSNPMTQPIHLIAEIYAVEVPDDADNYSVLSAFQPNTLSYEYSVEKAERCETGLIAMIDLPAGNWQLICTTKECTEDQAKGIAQPWAANTPDFYRNHEWPQGPNYYSSAVASVRSLVRSKGLDPDKTIIIKKV